MGAQAAYQPKTAILGPGSNMLHALTPVHSMEDKLLSAGAHPQPRRRGIGAELLHCAALCSSCVRVSLHSSCVGILAYVLESTAAV
jgi:hypothetical protein